MDQRTPPVGGDLWAALRRDGRAGKRLAAGSTGAVGGVNGLAPRKSAGGKRAAYRAAPTVGLRAFAAHENAARPLADLAASGRRVRGTLPHHRRLILWFLLKGGWRAEEHMQNTYINPDHHQSPANHADERLHDTLLFFQVYCRAASDTRLVLP